MAATNYWTRAYQDIAAETADRNHLLLLLFDALVRLLHQAHAEIQARHYEGQCRAIGRALDILSALLMALDDSHAPELCAHLRATYLWMHKNLVQASLADDASLVAQVLEVAIQLREAWRQADRQLRKQQTAEEAA